MKYKMEISSVEFSTMDNVLLNTYKMLTEYLKIPIDFYYESHSSSGYGGTREDPLDVEYISVWDASYESVYVHAAEYASYESGVTDVILDITFSDRDLILCLHKLLKKKGFETCTSIID